MSSSCFDCQKIYFRKPTFAKKRPSFEGLIIVFYEKLFWTYSGVNSTLEYVVVSRSPEPEVEL